MVLYEQISLGDLQAAQAAGTLKTGVVYEIINGSNNFTTGGELFEVLCISPTQLANTGTGIFQNCDWQNVGNYGDVLALTTIAVSSKLGMWQSLKGTITYDTLVGAFVVGETVTGGTSGATGIVTADDGSTLTLRALTAEFQSGEVLTGGTSGATANSTSVVTYTFNPAQGDIVIGWGGAGSNYWGHYQKITSTNSFVDPASDNVNYTFLPKDGSNYGYVTEVDEITYQVSNDTLQQRSDPHLNVTLTNFNNTIHKWTWGYAQNANNSGLFSTLDIKSKDIIFANNFGQQCNFTTPVDSIGSINSCNLGSNPSFSNNFLTNTASIQNINSSFYLSMNDNVLEGANIIEIIGNSFSISGNKMLVGTSIGGVSMEVNATINNSIISSGGAGQINIGNLTSFVLNTFNIQGAVIYAPGKTITLISSHSGESLYPGNSTMSADFDAAANEATGTLTIPTSWEYIGIFNNSTVPANPILAFSGNIPSDHLFTIAPKAGQTFTFTTTAVALAVGGNIISGLAGATTIILNGTNGDSATFKLIPANGFVQLVESVVAL